MAKKNKIELDGDQTTGATPPDLKLNQSAHQFQQSISPAVATGHGAGPDEATVAAGHGNQILDNETLRADQSKQDDLKPGALPDGTASIDANNFGNEDIEQAGKSRTASGIE